MCVFRYSTTRPSVSRSSFPWARPGDAVPIRIIKKIERRDLIMPAPFLGNDELPATALCGTARKHVHRRGAEIAEKPALRVLRVLRGKKSLYYHGRMQ